MTARLSLVLLFCLFCLPAIPAAAAPVADFAAGSFRPIYPLSLGARAPTPEGVVPGILSADAMRVYEPALQWALDRLGARIELAPPDAAVSSPLSDPIAAMDVDLATLDLRERH